jgi:hypothetical protein
MISTTKTKVARITTPSTARITVINPSDNPQLDNIALSHSEMELTGSLIPTLLIDKFQPKLNRTKRLRDFFHQPFNL